eukprot:TRINITY_DN169_c0_g3_i1.p1 TRINITY_DN169_c0_g3~~TRINITY_DN169_c0_g3_i1.p1  ORF type:complete len:480 (+),score=127.31 TRINITY_DN169_c0_g3_i1:303-1742(+)
MLDQFQKEKFAIEQEAALLKLEKIRFELEKAKIEEKVTNSMKNLKIQEKSEGPSPMDIDQMVTTARAVAQLLNNVKRLDPALLKIDEKKLLGEGAFGKVYSATYLKVKVAAKVVKRHESIDESFNNETNILSRLRHPNIVQCMGIIVEPERFVIALELVEGMTLDKFLMARRKADLPVDHGLFFKIAKQLAYALHYLHSQNPPIVHNDVKSLNIMMTITNDVKLLDFGLSRSKTASSATIATVNAVAQIGTIVWSAPEQLTVKLRRSRGPKSDVYSFSSVLFELLTLNFPYHKETQEGMSIPDIIQLVVEEKEKPEIPSNVSPHIAELLNSCWSWDPAGRPTMEKVLIKLDELNLPDPYPSIFVASGANKEELQDPTVTSVLLNVVQYVTASPRKTPMSADDLLIEILNAKKQLKPPMPGKLPKIPTATSNELKDVLKRAIDNRRNAFQDSIKNHSAKIGNSIWKEHLASKLIQHSPKI